MDQDKLSLSTSDVIGSIDDSFKSVAAEKIMENNNAVDVKGCEDDAKTGEREEIEEEDGEIGGTEQEILNESFESLCVSEVGSEFSFTTGNLAELSAELDEEDKKAGRNRAELIGLQMDQNLNIQAMQIQSLEKANADLRVSLDSERTVNAEFRHEIGRKDGILGEQEKKLTEYEARISEMANELNLLRKEKSISDSLAFQSATSRDEFLKKHEKLYEEKNELHIKIATLSSELKKSRTEFDNLSTATISKDAEYEQKLNGLTTENEFLQLELDSKKKELSETYGRIEKHDEKVKFIEDKYKRQKELLKKFNDQNQLIKEKYSALKVKYFELEESRKKDKKLHAYSIELMTKKALEGVRSPSAHSVRSASVSNARSSGAHCSVNRHKQTKQPEIIFLDDSEANGGSADGSAARKEKANLKPLTKPQAD